MFDERAGKQPAAVGKVYQLPKGTNVAKKYHLNNYCKLSQRKSLGKACPILIQSLA